MAALRAAARVRGARALPGMEKLRCHDLHTKRGIACTTCVTCHFCR